MYKYSVKWWSSIDWKWWEVELVAESEESVRAWVDKQTDAEYRHRPYKTPKEESLEIKRLEKVEFPLMVWPL